MFTLAFALCLAHAQDGKAAAIAFAKTEGHDAHPELYYVVASAVHDYGTTVSMHRYGGIVELTMTTACEQELWRMSRQATGKLTCLHLATANASTPATVVFGDPTKAGDKPLAPRLRIEGSPEDVWYVWASTTPDFQIEIPQRAN